MEIENEVRISSFSGPMSCDGFVNFNPYICPLLHGKTQDLMFEVL